MLNSFCMGAAIEKNFGKNEDWPGVRTDEQELSQLWKHVLKRSLGDNDYPSLLGAAFRVFSEIGFTHERDDGNNNLLDPLYRRSSSKCVIACGGKGTRCGRRIFIRSAGTRHVASSKPNSSHATSRNSPGRGARMANRCRAYLVPGRPEKPLMRFRRRPSSLQLRIADRDLTWGRISAPLRASVGSFEMRPVAMAQQNTDPILLRSLLAVS